MPVLSIYEVLDMSANERTKGLQFMDSTIAKFRHYVGAPVATPDGLNMRAVFAMCSSASTIGVDAA